MTNGLQKPYDHLSQKMQAEFSWDMVFSRRDDLPMVDGGGNKVCVIGGGISGLVIAYELHNRNYNVLILEAEERCGGRIKTHHFTEEVYGELGAMRVPLVHAAVHDYINLFKLPTRQFMNWNPHGRLYFNKAHSVFSQPSGTAENKIASHFQQLQKAFPGLRAFSPTAISEGPQKLLLNLLITPLLAEFQSELAKWNMFSTGESLLKNRLFSISLKEYALSDYIGMNNDDWTYFSRFTGIGPLEICSVGQFFFDMLPVLGSRMFEIVGGMEQLPKAFVQSIGEENILTNTKATNISVLDNEVEVGFLTQNTYHIQRFDKVVITIPPLSLKKIELNAPKSDLQEKYDALDNIEVRALSKSLFHCSRPFWVEDPAHAMGGLGATDLDIQQCWYPTIQEQDVSQSEAMQKDLSTKHSGYVFTGAYRWGKKAEEFGRLSESKRTLVTIADLSEFHNVSEEEIKSTVLDYTHKFWEEGYTFLASSKTQDTFLEAFTKPVCNANGDPKIFFAGEHISLSHGWIISAVISALGALKTILSDFAI